MSDDKMDELLIQGARDYNEPGAVPRDAMWARIVEARQAPPATDDRRQHGRGWVWTRIGVAAAILMAVGIVIGRRIERTTSTPVAPVASAPPRVTTPAAGQAQTTSPSNDSIIPRLREETQRTSRQAQVLASIPPRPTTNDSAADQPNLAYRLVMLRHIVGSEAMITAFRASARRGEVDTQIAGWARELLRTTRLLESSPVTDDPTMKRLLADLDLVLVQIAQYVARGTINADELDLIEQSINKRGVITKLRSSLPVRNTPAGT